MRTLACRPGECIRYAPFAGTGGTGYTSQWTEPRTWKRATPLCGLDRYWVPALAVFFFSRRPAAPLAHVPRGVPLGLPRRSASRHKKSPEGTVKAQSRLLLQANSLASIIPQTGTQGGCA